MTLTCEVGTNGPMGTQGTGSEYNQRIVIPLSHHWRNPIHLFLFLYIPIQSPSTPSSYQWVSSISSKLTLKYGKLKNTQSAEMLLLLTLSVKVSVCPGY